MHNSPALCPGYVLLRPIPLGQPPFLHCLRRLFTGFVRQLLRYYGAVRLPIFVHHWIPSLDFPVRSLKNFKDKYGISRFPRKMLPYVLKVSDRAGSECISRLRYIRYCLPYRPTTSAPWNIGISRLNTRPIRSPVNASAMSLLTQPHDSGSVWFATPSLYESFIHYTFPVLTGALWTSLIFLPSNVFSASLNVIIKFLIETVHQVYKPTLKYTFGINYAFTLNN